MSLNKKEKRKQVKALKKAHDRRAKLIEKVAQARAKFEKSSRKLQDVENDIAELSRAVFGPAGAQTSGDGAGQTTGMAPASSAKQDDAGAPKIESGEPGEQKATQLPDDPAASE